MKTFILSLLLFILSISFAQNSSDATVAQLSNTWDGLLKTYVNDEGKVDYQTWLDTDADKVQATNLPFGSMSTTFLLFMKY